MASFIEISQRAQLPSDDIHSITNAAVAHGIGLCNEYPLIVNRDHVAASGYDGEIEVGMVLCVEALAAPPGGAEAVKLEEQVVITESGPEPLSTFPRGLRPAHDSTRSTRGSATPGACRGPGSGPCRPGRRGPAGGR